MNLLQAECGKEYLVADVGVQDEATKAFLFTLGCYAGQAVSVVSKKTGTMVVAIKGARYTIDNNLASAIII